MKIAAAFLLLIASSGCAQSVSTPASSSRPPQQQNADLDLPGRGVTQEVASEWSCRFDALEDAAAEHINALSPGQTFRAEAGWDVCELLAKLGAPREVQRARVSAARSATLRYGTASDPHLVTVAFDAAENKWMVTEVDW